MGSILKSLNSSLFMRGDDTSEDKAKLLMSGKVHSMGILVIVHFFDQFYLPNDVLIMLLMTPPYTSVLGLNR